MHLRLDIYNQTRHAQTLMKELGITYQHATQQSVHDEWWFWNCEGIPSPLPEFLKPLEIDPIQCVGWGLCPEDAVKIRDYKP